jgi:hypothetical protein
MKKVFLFVLGSLLIMSCTKKEVEVSDKGGVDLRDCVLEDPIVSLTKAEAQKHIYHTWILKKIITMLPTEKVPNIKVQFKDALGAPIDKQIADIYIDDKLIGSVLYSLKETTFENIIYTNFETEVDLIGESQEYNFIRGGLRICKNQLMIDNGMAFDAPAYIFEKQ